MVGLLDIAPVTDSVEIRGETYQVRGLSVAAIASLLARFPVLKDLFVGGEGDFAAVVNASGEAVVAIITAGLGHLGEPDYEAALSNLTLDEQSDVFVKVAALTMPAGVVPFVQRLEKLMSLANPDPVRAGKGQATKSQKS